MRVFLGASVLILLVVILGVQIYLSSGVERKLSEEYKVLQAKLLKVTEDNQKLQAELEYLSDPNNLEKELRARFNYRGEGEKMFIIVPPSGSSTNP